MAIMAGPLFREPFGLERGVHRRAGGDAILEREDVGEWGKVELRVMRPARDGEEVGVGHGEGLAEEIVAAGELPLDERIAPLQELELFRAQLRAGLVAEEARVRLVDLGIDVAQHLLRARALEGAVGRRESRARLQVGEGLDDRGPPGAALALIGAGPGHVALRIRYVLRV